MLKSSELGKKVISDLKIQLGELKGYSLGQPIDRSFGSICKFQFIDELTDN